jgi:hypothetical protein
MARNGNMSSATPDNVLQHSARAWAVHCVDIGRFDSETQTTREVRRTRRATATEGRARVASEHGATRVVARTEYAGASVRVGTEACRSGKLDTVCREPARAEAEQMSSRGRKSITSAKDALTTCGVVVVVGVIRTETAKAAAALGVVVGAEAPESAAERHDAVDAAGARACVLRWLAVRGEKSRWARELVQLRCDRR